MSRVKIYEIRAVVCPRQKVVKIMRGNELLKKYNFKMDIPNKQVERLVFVHDYSEWCVADREYHYTQKDIEWDKELISKIERDSLDYYHKQVSENGYVKGGGTND